MEEIKTINLNFKADEPTKNNRIYPKDVLLEALAERKEIPVEVGALFHRQEYDELYSSTAIHVGNMAGMVSLNVKEDNSIKGEFKPYINTDAYKLIKNIPFENLEFTSKGIGELEIVNGITYIKKIKLISIIILPPDEIIELEKLSKESIILRDQEHERNL